MGAPLLDWEKICALPTNMKRKHRLSARMAVAENIIDINERRIRECGGTFTSDSMRPPAPEDRL
jgi:hypothetical protein